MWSRVESWLKSRFEPPQPEGPPRLVRAFDATDEPICRGIVTPDEGAWRIECRGPQICRLFEVGNPGVEQCLLAYRARLRTESPRPAPTSRCGARSRREGSSSRRDSTTP
jgi:hypothetical protein